MIGDVAAKKLGWGVLHVQALQEESLVAVLLQRIPGGRRALGAPGPGFPGPPGAAQCRGEPWLASAGATVRRSSHTSTPSVAAAFEDALGRVGSFAAAHGTGLLITFDEAQAAPPEDVSAVARAPCRRWWPVGSIP